jgi:hypothetical protein
VRQYFSNLCDGPAFELFGSGRLFSLAFVAACGIVFLSTTLPAAAQTGSIGCTGCHDEHRSGFSAGHAFAASGCTLCHSGNDAETDEAAAHAGLIAFPGNLDNAEQVCGNCHADRVASVSASLMHTARGMVHTTRTVIDGHPGPEHTQNLQSLGDTVADSMLRKQCASCHLGQPKTAHAVDVTRDRGGGCLACHIAEHPDDAHPALSADVSDGRCFGCHSRSGRISLSFAGLAEVDQPGLRLADGRNVARMPADVHYEAGMRCTSCHTADDVMGSPPDAVHQRDAVMAACTDCHEPHAEDTHHARLECSACHSQWAPQCLGCHMEYDEEGEQWDHIDRKVTAGRWSDRRWDIRNTLPALGVNANGRIEAFVPGMIMTIAHPSWDEEKFVRVFAPLSPHTTGPSRSCESCHRSSEALGLGRGELELVDGELRFTPAGEHLRDGLPADAWTNIENTLGGRSPVSGQRPFNAAEMKKILSAEIQQDSAPAGGNGSSSSASSSSNTGGTNSASGRRAAPSPRSPTK